MPLPDLDDPNIASVGLPGETIGWYPTAMYWCKCKPNELTIVVLTGLKNPAQCFKCNNLYHIVGFKQTPHGLSVIIERILIPTGPTGVM